jgi:hypothetical protein
MNVDCKLIEGVERIAYESTRKRLALPDSATTFQIVQCGMPFGEIATRFHTKSPISSSLLEFYQRIGTHLDSEGELLDIVAVLMHRIHLKHDILTRHTMHRLLIGCMALATKMFFDEYWSLPEVARCCGVSVTEATLLEMEAWKALECRVLVTNTDIRIVRKALQKTTRIPSCNPTYRQTQLQFLSVTPTGSNSQSCPCCTVA